jgi:K+-sensing histidine kinase KdpD
MAVPNNSERAVLPLIFLAVVITLALRFGEGAGILGTLIAAGIFAYFLFSPVGSFHIGNEVAKTNLGWMLLVGISASFLLSPPSDKKPRRHRLDKEHRV